MRWRPLITFVQTAMDAANAMVSVPGKFGSFGHDYRGDMVRFVHDGFQLPAATEQQLASIQQILQSLELERAERIKALHAQAAPPAPAHRAVDQDALAGVPLRTRRTGGARWLRGRPARQPDQTDHPNPGAGGCPEAGGSGQSGAGGAGQRAARGVTAVEERPELREDERAELERLRAEVAALRAQQGQPAVSGGEGAAGGAGRAGRQRWRTLVAVVLIVLGCVLAPLSVVAIWTRNQVTNTDRYVATVTPLAADPAVQQAITDQITAQVFTYIDIQALTTQAVDALSARVEGRGLPPQAAAALQGLAGPVANGVQGFVRTQVERIVQSQAFEDAWIQANRVAHEALVKALTGEGGGAVTVEGDTVSLNLAPFIQTVKQQLVAQGFTLAERIPQVDKSFVLFQSQDITRAQRAFSLLNTLGVWLPVIAIVLLVLGVYVAKDHRRALVGAGLGRGGRRWWCWPWR